ncbi:site-specific integrase [Desulfobacter sp.]|uniref:tyrosine-type recombinase/integrase n=1 Tax=Desulfobacter sp. TaxID=2294 RepID=UPI000E919FB1|nr:site-specific integrase [Desulfobacter sp.]HBT88854.1 integrase [Desulfobacter sp.]
MAAKKRVKTKYAGVFYLEGISAQGKPEKIYYIRYRKNGKMVEEKAGRQYQDDMTPARASGIRGQRIDGEQATNQERREVELADKSKPTISRLWEEYQEAKTDIKGIVTDKNRFENHIKIPLGNKTPDEIIPLDIDRVLRSNGLRDKAPATKRNSLELLRRIINFGINRNRCNPLKFKLELPTVDNEKTEELTTEQLTRLLEVLETAVDQQVANIMRIALFTGMRRGEIFKLEHRDLNFETGFITLRDPKGGKDQKIPMNSTARQILESQDKVGDSPYVFPGRSGKRRVCVKKAVNKIKEEAGIPKGFRALHGLRHVYASMLASSGQVDMYVLQKLMTHKSPKMTQRYAHLRDDALKNAANQLDDILKQQELSQDKKVVNIQGNR